MSLGNYLGVQPYFTDDDRQEILAEIDAILRSGQLTQGGHLKRFEAAAAAMAGVRHAIAVNSGGTALELALEAFDVGGADVVVPTETFVATANSVMRAGGRPVFADLRLDDLAVSAESIERALTPNTKAVVLVHMFGLMSSQISAIQELCRQRGLALFEDAAHAHGATFDGRPAGSLGLAGCFSYYATKVITTGEGGMITTDDDALAERLRCIRDHGRTAGTALFGYPGNNYRLAEIPAILGWIQHRRLGEIVEHRRRIAAIYRSALHDAPHLRIADPAGHDGHSYWRYAVLLDESVDRDTVQQRLLERVGARITWMYEPLCHQQPLYVGAGQPALPVAESVVGRLINLPTHSGVDDDGAARIAAELRAVAAELAGRA